MYPLKLSFLLLLSGIIGCSKDESDSETDTDFGETDTDTDSDTDSDTDTDTDADSDTDSDTDSDSDTDTDSDSDSDTDETDTDDTDVEPTGLAIAGDWAEVYGAFPDNQFTTFHAIREDSWDMGYAQFEITQYGDTYAIAHNAATNTFYGDKWSRFDWTESGGQLYYCATAYNAADETAALNTPGADTTQLTTGCGGFSWSTLSTPLPIRGAWNDGFYAHEIDEANWTMGDALFNIYKYDVDAEYAIAQNDGGNEYNPGKWSRLDWTIADGDVYYCQSAYAAESAELAEAASADAGNLAAGCGGFSWSELSPIPDTL